MFNIGGSPRLTQQNAGIADAAGVPVWLQVVGLGLGVSGAFATHLHTVVSERQHSQRFSALHARKWTDPRRPDTQRWSGRSTS